MIPIKKFRFMKNRRGLSLIVTTLIMLTFSVLLALTAINYTNGVTRSRMKSTGQENIRYHKTHAWVQPLANGTDRSVVAFKIHNLGGKSISVQILDIRGSEMNWQDVYYHVINETAEPDLMWIDLPYKQWVDLTGATVNIGGYNYNQSTGSFFVHAGNAVIAYIRCPEIIFQDNIGMPILLSVGTVNANFVTETVVELAPN